jgi:hypothetical protein
MRELFYRSHLLNVEETVMPDGNSLDYHFVAHTVYDRLVIAERSLAGHALIDMLFFRPVPMPKPQPGPNRHYFRVWIKMAIQSGLVDKLPPLYEPDGSQSPQDTEAYARQLLVALRDPDASKRTLQGIMADARQFKQWVEAYRKDGRRRMLVESRPEDRIIEMTPRRPRTMPTDDSRPRRTAPPDTNPRLHPMWDDWIDRLERQ